MHIRSFFVATTALTLTSTAAAQSIDYNTLEMLFGEAVTTSATGSAMRLPDAPATMEIITADDIRSSGATDLPGVLSRVSGISTQRFSRNAVDVAVRGYNRSMSPRLLVLVNGRQVYIDIYGYTQWDLIPVQMEEIRQIEIVKGPNSALFGFNAVAGVVNIITYNPEYDDQSTLNARVESTGGIQGSLVHSMKLGKRGFARASIGGYQHEDFDVIENRVENFGQDPKRLAASLDVGFRVADKTIVSFEGTYSELDTFEKPAVPTVYQMTQYEASSVRGSLDSEGAWGLFSADVYQNKMIRSYNSAPGIDAPDMENTLLVAKAENVFKPFPAHTFRVALEYRENELENLNTATTIGLPDFVTSFEVLSAGMMWHWKISDKVTSTIAARVDSFTSVEDLTEESYNAALVWAASDSTTLKFQAARGVQVPSLLDIVFIDSVTPTIVDNYAIDLEHRIEKLNGSFKASVFYQDNQSMRQIVLHPITTLASLTVADSTMTGVELSVNGESGAFTWDASYTYVNPDDDLTPAASVLPFGEFNFEDLTPANEAKFNWEYKRDKFSFGSSMRYVDDKEYLDMTSLTGRTNIDSYVATDARIAYQVKDNVVLSLEGQDLTNDRDVQVLGGDVERRAQLSLTVDM